MGLWLPPRWSRNSDKLHRRGIGRPRSLALPPRPILRPFADIGLSVGSGRNGSRAGDGWRAVLRWHRHCSSVHADTRHGLHGRWPSLRPERAAACDLFPYDPDDGSRRTLTRFRRVNQKRQRSTHSKCRRQGPTRVSPGRFMAGGRMRFLYRNRPPTRRSSSTIRSFEAF